MPVYEYKCNKCNEEFDFEHSMSDCIDECPICREIGGLERLIPAGLGVKGISIGRFSTGSDNTFEHFHVPTEIRQHMKKAESDGMDKKDPKGFATMKKTYDRIMKREYTYSRVDYQKTGHPAMKQKGNLAEI